MTPEQYRLRISGPAAKALSELLPEKIAGAAYAFITGPLLDDPRRVGKPLEVPLAPAWSARRGEYRVLHLIDEETRTVQVRPYGTAATPTVHELPASPSRS